jgi:type I restriction enzyme S subunit
VVTPRDELWFGVLLGHLSSEEFIDYTDASSGGTRMPRTSWHDMKRYKIAVPPESLAQKLTEHYRRAAAVFAHNREESRTLAALRDMLLPKLLGGELRVGAGSASREAGS